MQISTEEGKGFAEEIGAVFSETSALTATNVAELFVEIGKFVQFCIMIPSTAGR